MSSHNRRHPRSACQITGKVTFDNESEEHIIRDGVDVMMQDLHTIAVEQSSHGAIMVSKQVSVTTEEYGDSFRHAETSIQYLLLDMSL